jgi:hypothetical protein
MSGGILEAHATAKYDSMILILLCGGRGRLNPVHIVPLRQLISPVGHFIRDQPPLSNAVVEALESNMNII